MESNPKKSKAFIITFIAVLLLLIMGYFLFKNSEQIFGTKNSANINKIFAPLLGSSKSKDVTTIDTVPKENTGTTTTDINTSGTTTDPNITGGFVPGSFGDSGSFGTGQGFAPSGGFNIVPPLNPISTPSGGSNGGGGTGGGPTPSPTPTPTPTPVVTAYCPTDDPLIFTDAEKLELESLLKDYYTISYAFKTADDIELLEADIKANQALVDQSEKLNNECVAQKSDFRYTGPNAIKDNPYYSTPVNSIAPYVPTYETLEDLFKVW
jgi:hypothetical protein